MKKKVHSVEQIIKILREAESGQKVSEVCRRANITEPTYYRWKRKYGDMGISEARRLKGLESENIQLKKLVAEQALRIQVLEEINSKKW